MPKNHLADIAQKFDANEQNAHGVTIENSYYGFLYDLANYYFPKCIHSVNTHGASSSTDSGRTYIIRENKPGKMAKRVDDFIEGALLPVIENAPLSAIKSAPLSVKAKAYLQRKLAEPLHEDLDKKTFTVIKNGEIVDIIVWLPLKSSFGIVLTGLLDDDAWADGIVASDTPEQKKEKHNIGRRDRLESLNELIEKQVIIDSQRLYCHTGVTEDWTQLLNGHRGKTLVMEDDDFIMKGVRDYVFVMLCHGFPDNTQQSTFDYVQDRLHPHGVLSKTPLTWENIRPVLVNFQKPRPRVIEPAQARAIAAVIKAQPQDSFSLPLLKTILTTAIKVEPALSEEQIDKILTACAKLQKPLPHPVSQVQYTQLFAEWQRKQSMPKAHLALFADVLLAPADASNSTDASSSSESAAPSQSTNVGSSTDIASTDLRTAHSLQTYLEQCYQRQSKINIRQFKKEYDMLIKYCNIATLKTLNCDFTDKLAFINDWIKRHTKYTTVGHRKPRNFLEALAPQVLDWLNNHYSIEDPTCAEQFRFITRLYDTWKVIDVDANLLKVATIDFYQALSYFSELRQQLQAGMTDVAVSPNIPVSASSSAIVPSASTDTGNNLEPLTLHTLINDAARYIELKNHIDTFSQKKSLLNKDTYKAFIENFLEKSLRAVTEQDPLTQIDMLITLASLCIRDEAEGCEIILLKDETIETIFAKVQEAHIRWLTDNILNPDSAQFNDTEAVWLEVYWINRLILCGLIKPPTQWSPSLALNLRHVCQFIRHNFNEPDTHVSANALRQASYPPALLTHIEYLITRYEYELALRTYQERQASHSLEQHEDIVSDTGDVTNIPDESEPQVPEALSHNWIFSPHYLEGGPHQFTLIQQLAQHLEAKREPVLWLLRHVVDVNVKLLVGMYGETTTALMQAIAARNMPWARALIAAGADIEQTDNQHRTALHWACALDYSDAMSLLLDNHANMNAVDMGGLTPLMVAVIHNKHATAKLLLAKKPDLTLKSKNNKSILQIAIETDNPAMPELFVDEYVTQQNFTPLALAIEDFHEKLTLTMIQRSTNLELRNPEGETALSLVIKHTLSISIIEELLEKEVDINTVNNTGTTPLMWAILTGAEIELPQRLIALGAALEPCNKPNWILEHDFYVNANPLFRSRTNNLLATTFIHATKKGNIALVRILLIGGIHADLRYEQGPRRPLRTVYDEQTYEEQNQTALYWAVRLGHPDLVNLLLAHGANVNQLNHNNDTLLMLAVREKQPAVAKLLLTKVPDYFLQLRNNQDETAQHIALRMDSLPFDIKSPTMLAIFVDDYVVQQRYSPLAIAIEYDQETLALTLIEQSANLELTNVHGETALHLAVKYQREKIIAALLRKNANINAQDNSGMTPLMLAIQNKSYLLAMLITPVTDFTLLNHRGETALSLAIKYQNCSIIGPIVNRAGMTPLTLAICHNLEDLALRLIACSPDLEQPNSQGQTVLHIAVIYDRRNIITALLQSNVNINAQDKSGMTPLMWAIVTRQVILARRLVAAGTNLELCNAQGQTASILAKIHKIDGIIPELQRQRHHPIYASASSSSPMFQPTSQIAASSNNAASNPNEETPIAPYSV